MSNSNRITRESMDSIIEEIMGISDCDWLSDDRAGSPTEQF